MESRIRILFPVLITLFFTAACSIEMIAGPDDGLHIENDEAILNIVPAFRTHHSVDEDPRQAEQFATQNRIALQTLNSDIRLLNRINPSVRHTLVTESNDSDFKYTDYIKDWKFTLELYSNSIYRKGLNRRPPNGNVLVDVAIAKSGQLYSYRIILSSGPPALDAAIKDIILNSAPYTPLTSKIKKNTDVLHIAQMWQFRN